VASFGEILCLMALNHRLRAPPKSEFIINPCPTERRAAADGDRTAERIIPLRRQSPPVLSRVLKLLNAEIIIFSSRWERASLIDLAE